MTRLSIRQKAIRANGRSYTCNKCPFLFNGMNMEICRRCSNSFREGYEKGYKLAKKELSSNT